MKIVTDKINPGIWFIILLLLVLNSLWIVKTAYEHRKRTQESHVLLKSIEKSQNEYHHWLTQYETQRSLPEIEKQAKKANMIEATQIKRITLTTESETNHLPSP